MAIVNRDLDASEQKDVFFKVTDAAVGVSQIVYLGKMDYPAVVQSARACAIGVSGAPEAAFVAYRFTSGGLTAIALGVSNLVMSALGTSGIAGYSGLAAPGATVLNVQADDVLAVITSGANSASTRLLIDVVVKKTQDIVSHNGIQS